MCEFLDLNLNWTEDRSGLRSLIETAAQLGFSTVALNYTFELSKKKKEVPRPTPVDQLFERLPVVQGRSRPIRVLNRLTLLMSEAGHFRPAAPEYRHYDLLAVQPMSEKLFHAACMTYDVDIVCICVTEKLPFSYKRAPVNGAIERGVVFEVSYAAAIRDSTMRRYAIANAVNLMERCKGKGVIVSSAAEKALEIRGPYDVTNLALLFGLSDKGAKASVSSTCRSVLQHAESRKTAGGVIYTFKVSGEQQEAEPTSDPSDGAPVAKKPKPDS